MTHYVLVAALPIVITSELSGSDLGVIGQKVLLLMPMELVKY